MKRGFYFMKNVVLEEIENQRKVFTKKKEKDIIKKNCNPLKVNYKRIYKRGSGLYMENIILKEIRKNLDWKDKIISHTFSKTLIKVYKLGIEKGFNSRI